MRATFWIVLSVFLGLGVPLSGRADEERGEGVAPASGAAADSATVTSLQAETLHAFDQWAAQQAFYTRPMIVDMRERLLAAFASLSPSEAAQYRDEFSAKLSIFREPQAQATEQW